MDKFLVLMCMLAAHVFADYFLQGVMAQMKQRNWWRLQVKDYDKSIYRNDHKAVLLNHSFQWSFVVLLPVLYDIYYKAWGFEPFAIKTVSIYIGLIVMNTFVHYKIDNLKANKNAISLVTDQLVHFAQIVVTWLVYFTLIGWTGWY